jgi:hypothetical protein
MNAVSARLDELVAAVGTLSIVEAESGADYAALFKNAV